MMDMVQYKKLLKTVAFTAFCAALLWAFVPSQSVFACSSCKDTAEEKSGEEWGEDSDDLDEDATTPRIKRRIESEFTAQRIWIVNLLWEDNILPAMKLMTEQITAVANQQVKMIGALFDAKHQMETQQTLRELNLQAHKDYQPSQGVCRFGTTIRSLAASEQKGAHSAFVLSQYGQDRMLGQQGNAGMTATIEGRSRLADYKQDFCDENDNSAQLGRLCSSGSGATIERRNADIDYARVIDWPWTLDVDFTNSDLTNDEQDVFALANTLFSHDIMVRPLFKKLRDDPNPLRMPYMQELYQNLRAVAAKRAVAQNSFNQIVALKSVGTDGSREYLLEVLKGVGLDDDSAEAMLADREDKEIAPSYYAQMHVIGKKAFQDPNFYTNLYDSPANVERKGVAVQAINLMQKFDMLDSYLRREMNTSLLLEQDVNKLQNVIEAEIDEQPTLGESAL